jgi:hypothetical protein
MVSCLVLGAASDTLAQAQVKFTPQGDRKYAARSEPARRIPMSEASENSMYAQGYAKIGTLVAEKEGRNQSFIGGLDAGFEREAASHGGEIVTVSEERQVFRDKGQRCVSTITYTDSEYRCDSSGCRTVQVRRTTCAQYEKAYQWVNYVVGTVWRLDPSLAKTQLEALLASKAEADRAAAEAKRAADARERARKEVLELDARAKSGDAISIRRVLELAKDRNGTPWMTQPIQKGKIEVVREFLAQGAKPDWWSLAVAASAGQIDILILLLDQGIPLTVPKGRPSLLHFAAQGPAQMIYGDYPEEPIGAAAVERQLRVIKFLLERGIPVDIRDRYDESTPLMWAAYSGRVEAAKALLDAGADPNAKAKKNVINSGKTALAIAAFRSHDPEVGRGAEEVFSILRARGAKP